MSGQHIILEGETVAVEHVIVPEIVLEGDEE